MNYQRHYDKLILRARIRGDIKGYHEKHHIKPRCMGGNDEKSNIVKLYPEEHFIAHRLLCKIYPDNSKLLYAFFMMIDKRKRKNKLYGFYKKEFANIARKRETGKKHTYKHRMRNALSNRGRIQSEEWRRNISKGKIGKTHRPTPRDQVGEKNSCVILCDENVIEIKKFLRDTTMTLEQIARLYGVSESTIANIKYYRNWTHVAID